MTTYLGKSCSFCLPRVPFVNCRQFMYLVISLLVLRAGYEIWLYQFLIIAYLFTLLTDQHTSVSILVGWPINIPAYLNLTTYLGWLYDQHTSLFTRDVGSDCISSWSLIIFLILLCDQQTSLSILVDWLINKPVSPSGLADRSTYQPIDLGWVNNKHTWPSFLVDWPTCILAYLS